MTFAQINVADILFVVSSTKRACCCHLDRRRPALDHVINTSQIVEAQSAAIVGGSVVLSGGQ